MKLKHYRILTLSSFIVEKCLRVFLSSPRTSYIYLKSSELLRIVASEYICAKSQRFPKTKTLVRSYDGAN